MNDENIFYTASVINEYLLPDIIDPKDVIIDIGAHIGGFICGCLKRGARNIYAYESLKENYDVAESIFEDEIKSGIVKLFNLAVWRSDIDNPIKLYNSGFCQPGNSGTNVVVYDCPKISPVNTISLDEIISEMEEIEGIDGVKKIKLIKMDCEGSEFPILFTSKKLSSVDYICGEYHMINLCNFSKDGKSKFSEQDLYDHLDSQGFSTVVSKNPFNNLIGIFYAKKNHLITFSKVF